jgi:TonB-linked SusC/RagA family outer membrane protein
MISKRTIKFCQRSFIRLEFLLLFILAFQVAAFGQEKQVKGRVTDASGVPLPGVHVVIQGTQTGTVTDTDGKFALTVSNESAVLVFSYVGFLEETVTVGSQTDININLAEDILQLSEVVVVGYGTVKKSDLTGAVSVVTSDDIERVKARDLTHAMQGLSSGVQILNSSGTPGSNPIIRIRGVGTINSADPLIVVDGLRMGVSDLEFINTSDIESVSVLKDASAAAIYGLGAANGVIMVTTKKAKEGKMMSSFNAYYGWQKPTHFMDVLSGPEWAEITNQMAGSTLLDPDTVADVNWFEEITRTAPMQNYDFSVSGASEKSNFLFSAGYLDQQGIMVRTFYKRFTARLNSEHKITKWLKVGENLNIARTRYENMRDDWDSYNRPIGNGMYSPITPPYDENGNYQRRVFPQPYRSNPLEDANRGTTNNRKTAAIGAVYMEGTFLKDFTLLSRYNINYLIDEQNSYRPGYDDGAGAPVLRSELFNQYSNYFTWLWETTLEYHKTLESHDIRVMAGYTRSKYGQYNDMSIRNQDGPYEVPEILRYFSSGLYADTSYIQTGAAQYATSVGFLGRVNYAFKDRYLLTASIRYDGSSRFYNHLFEAFPAVSVAWKISNESWMKDLIGNNSLKIRLGWGKTGNDNIPTGAETEQVLSQMGYTFNDSWSDGRSVTTPANPNLIWETTIQKNIGVDASFWNNKLEITGDYYIRNTQDMLVQPAPPLVNGTPVMPYINAGEMLNKGIELMVNYRNRISRLSYDVGANISHIKNEVISVGDEYGSITPTITYGQNFTNMTRTEAGYPMAYFYGYVVEGIFQSYEEVREHAFQNRQTQPGDFKYKDLNGDGIITNADQTMVGSPHPKLTYGFNINLEYSGLDFQTLFAGVYDVDILMPYKTNTHKYIADGRNFSADLLDSWTPENTDTDIPRLTTSDPNGNLRAQVTSFYVEDGSYLRMKVLQLGYTIPASITSRVGVQKLRFYVSGQNVLTFTKYSGNDPEIGFSRGTNNAGTERKTLLINVDFINVPQPKTWLFGVNLTF